MSNLQYFRQLKYDRSYSTTIMLASGLSTSSASEFYSALGNPNRLAVVVDRHVYRTRPDVRKVIKGLEDHASQVSLSVQPGGELMKTLNRASKLVSWFDERAILRRSEPVVAFGGGALLDSVSFAATLYRRGIPCVRVPTTLLSMIDGSIGAKNGLNFNRRKNLVGTLAPAARVIIDPVLLTSLSSREMRSGVAEMLKAAMIANRQLFELMENSFESMIRSKFQSAESLRAITMSISTMIDSIWADLWETNLERPMDFGHSLSKIFEEQILPRPAHGQAVAFDMAISSATAQVMGLLAPCDFNRFLKLILRSRLSIDNATIDPEMLDRAIADTRVHRDGNLTCPLPDEVGHAVFVPLHTEELIRGQQRLRSSVSAF